MMKMKKITAALLAMVLMVAMLSCITIGASAAPEMSGPVSIEKVKVGLDVSGKELDNNCFVVSSAWSGLKAGTQVNVKLGGVIYKAYIGGNAYAEIADAVENANGGMAIYVTAGSYYKEIHAKAAGLKIYGPYAGVTPNAVANATNAIDLKNPNPNRPAAANASDNATEAVINCLINIYKQGSNLTVDGVFFGSNGGLDILVGGVRYGTYIANCISTSSKSYVFNMDAGLNMDLVAENNRILSGVGILNMAGFGDATLRSNYFNNSARAIFTHGLSGATMGIPILVENNYWENSHTIFSYDPSDLRFPSAYTVSIKGNYVNNFTGGYIVENNYVAMKSVPGINIHVTGNIFKGIKNTPFRFPFKESPNNPLMARFLVNINENYFEIGKATTFIDSAMNATLNCARNYYTSPMTADRVIKYKDSTLILYPYYADPEMTTLVGGASINAINLDPERFGVVLDQENKEVIIDFRGEGMDCIDLTSIIGVDEGSTWKMYKTPTLSEEVKGNVAYFDGIETVRYVAVTGADGESTTIYRFIMINDLGTEAKLLAIDFDTTAVPEPVVTGTHYVYNLDSETAVLNYDLHVSNGATYTLWKDSQCVAEPLTDNMDGYIPYTENGEGYKVFVKIESEDGNATGKYTLEFVRPRSANYDPGVLSVITPETDVVLRVARKTIYYYCAGIQKDATFDFAVTPGATYTIYADNAHTKELSSAADIREIALNEGQNYFYVEVKDAKGSNDYILVADNGTRSSDNAIVSASGTDTITIAGDKIGATSGLGDSVSMTFITNNLYATVAVYADEQRTLPIAYYSNPVTENGRTIDERTFDLQTKQPVSKYYVVCTAENGATRVYTLLIEKNFHANTFVDVASDAWYTASVNKAASLGLMNGSETGAVDKETGDPLYAFRPTAKITRQEVAVIIASMTGHNPDAFAKVALPYTDKKSISGWAKRAVQICHHYGYMEGSGNKFSPKAYISRQELMVVFARIYDLNGTTDLSAYKDGNKVASWAKAGVQACVKAGIIEGSGNKLNPTGNITRAEVATMIERIESKIGLYN